MKTITTILVTLIASSNCLAQSDTVLLKKQKGFLFLSIYNYLYDYDGDHMRPLGFHDFFFPSNCKSVKCFLDKSKTVLYSYSRGLRVDFIAERKQLKSKAAVFPCVDTSGCYKYNEFYIVPVIIDYELFEDYEPYICGRNYFELQLADERLLKFEYLHKAIKSLKIIPGRVVDKKSASNN